MLDELNVAGLGVIASAHLDFDPALTVITGETGAGKTMLLTALALLRGERADPSLVRAGAAAASVEGIVTVEGSSAAAAAALEAGGEVEDGQLIVARTVAASGRSRSHLGGRTVPQAVLTNVMEPLVTVHGQADQMRLRSPAQQRSVLDEAAGDAHAQTLASYRAAYSARERARARIEEITANAFARAQEADALRFALQEIERVAPKVGEDDKVAEQVRRLSHAEEIRAAVAASLGAIMGDEDALDQVSAAQLIEIARRELEHVAGVDAGLGDLAERIAEIGYLLSDAGSELTRHLADLDADPDQLAEGQERLAALRALTRKYGESIADVLDWGQASAARLADLDTSDDTLAALREEEQRLTAQVNSLGAVVTEGRREAAADLSSGVGRELEGLAMAGARLQIELTPLPEPGPSGADQIEFLFASHASLAPRPLGKAASGGELSRVMLAIEVSLAARGGAAPATLVFDEVDAGVGGAAAIEIGARLARLAASAQVIVVTHLAQVAAFADRHLVVSRGQDEDEIVVSGVEAVEGEDRLRELARMLAGQQDSASAREHAAELLALAGESRA